MSRVDVTRRATGTLSIAFLLASGSAARLVLGQATTDGRSLDLQTVLDAVLLGSPRLQIEWRELDRSRAMRLRAHGPFDTQVNTWVTSQRDNTLTQTGLASARASYVAVDALQYQVALERQLRSGVVLAPTLNISQSRLSTGVSAPSGTAAAYLKVGVPLLNNRGGGVAAGAERAAELGLQGSTQDLSFVASEVVRDATNAYWTYTATQHRLSIQLEAEVRARRMTDETARLVQADERPASDLKQLQANLAAKRAARITAEQRISESQRDLGLALGWSADQIERIPAPTTPFPLVDVPQDSNTSPVGRYLVAAAGRADVLARVRRSEASRVEADAAVRNLRARLDLSLSVGYQGFAAGWGVPGLVSSLHQNTSGLNGSVQLSYQLPMTNSLARGGAALLEAYHQQQQIGVTDAQRRSTTAVHLAWSAVGRSRASLEESRRAVALYVETVENEQTKFRLGTSTLFDIINAEDALTSARLAEVASLLGHALSLVELRFVTGTIIESSAGKFVARAPLLVSLP